MIVGSKCCHRKVKLQLAGSVAATEKRNPLKVRHVSLWFGAALCEKDVYK